MEAALRDSFAAYERVLKRPCRLFRFGDGWLAGWALDLVARLGAEIDLTLEPGWPARPGLVEDEPHRGGLPDRRGAPLAPYRRQGLNFRHRAWIGGRTPWLLPITTGALGAGGGVPAGQFSQLLWGMPPAALAPLLETAFSNGRRPVVVSVMRSEVSLGLVDRLEAGFAELARRPDIARHPVMTPAEALDAIGKRLSPARGAASPWAGSRPVSDIMEAV